MAISDQVSRIMFSHRNYSRKLFLYWLNLIFSVKLEDPDDDDEVDNCTIVIGLIQKGRRKQKRVGAQNLTIGFSIYKV